MDEERTLTASSVVYLHGGIETPKKGHLGFRIYLDGGIETLKNALRYTVPLPARSPSLILLFPEGEHGTIFFQPQADRLHQFDAP